MKCTSSFNPVGKITHNDADTERSCFRNGKLCTTGSKKPETPSLHALFVMHFAIQFKLGNEQAWLMDYNRMDDESNKNGVLQESSRKSPACYAVQERDLPRFILSSYFCSNTQHVAIFITVDFCYKKKGGQWWWQCLSASPRAVGTQVLHRGKISLPLPNYLKKTFYYLKIETHFSNKVSFHLSLSNLSPLECQRCQTV